MPKIASPLSVDSYSGFDTRSPSGVSNWISSSPIIDTPSCHTPGFTPYPRTLNGWPGCSSTRRRFARAENFRLLFLGQLVSLLGSNLTLVAVAYQVYQLTGSSLWVGLVSLIQLPLLILGSLWGGALGDRFDRRTLLVGASFAARTAQLRARRERLAASRQLRRARHAARARRRPRGALGTASHRRHPDARAARGAGRRVLAQPDHHQHRHGRRSRRRGRPHRHGRPVVVLLHRRRHLLRARARDVPHVGDEAGRPAHGSRRSFARSATAFRYVRRHAVVQAVYLVDLNAMVFGLPRALFPAVDASTSTTAVPRSSACSTRRPARARSSWRSSPAGWIACAAAVASWSWWC